MSKLKEAKLFKKATDTQSLSDRAASNKSYGSHDFDAWVDGLFKRFVQRRVLDVCCGTGNQLVKYARYGNLVDLCGVDVSSSSLETASRRLDEIDCTNVMMVCSKMEEMFSSAGLADRTFDLISCFYGLYYSEDAEQTLQNMKEHLDVSGSLLVVGPYGQNNQALYDILQRYFPLPPFVLWSSTDFMTELVAPWLESQMSAAAETFVNAIRFPSVDAVLDYWKASTFYRGEYLSPVKNDLESHFDAHGEFVLEKHVMACWGEKS